MSSLGRRLRELRGVHSQAVIADELSVSPALLSSWENGHSVPTERRLPALAQLFGVSVNELAELRRHSLVEADMAQGQPPDSEFMVVLQDIRWMLRDIRDLLQRWEGPRGE